MCSIIRILINVVKTCKKTFCVCRKSKRIATVFGPQQGERTRHVINASSDIPQEAGSSESIDLPEETAVISSVHQETTPTPVDISHTDVYGENLQSKRKTKRVRRRKVKSRLNTEDVLLAGETGPATENAADFTLRSCSNNEGEPCTSQAMVASEQSDDAGVVVEFRRISSKRTEISVSSRCETAHENKHADASNKSRGNTAIAKSSEHKKGLAKRLRQKTIVKPGAEKLLPVNVDESGNPANVPRSNNEEEPCDSLSGVMVVRGRAEDAGEVSGNGGIVTKPRKRRVNESGDAPCAKEQLSANKPDRIRSCHTGKSSSVRFDSVEQTMMVEEECMRISHDDFKLDFKEMKIEQSHKRGLTKPANELKNSTHCVDESGRRVSQLPEITTPNQNITSSIPSEILNRYTIGDRLGDGNFAVVYQCFDKRINSEYALKVIKNVQTPLMSEMIENELSILRTLSHPNIIHLISELVTPTEVYLITELVRGGDLFGALVEGPEFSARDNRLIMKNLTSALAYLHGLDIVHRDVKPENLLVEYDSDGRVSHVKLADFGLSQKVTEPLYAVCGTPMYMAPEILNQEGYGVKIDVWGAGVILYILLCGFPPFFDDNQEELFDKIRIGTFCFPEPYWDNVSIDAKHLVSSMLQSDPSSRYSAEDVLVHSWCDDHDL